MPQSSSEGTQRTAPDAGEGASRSTVCPYCGTPKGGGNRCEHCGGHTDPLSMQASQNEMGPWFVRDPGRPFRPGCRLETIERWVRAGRIKPDTVIRGPSTNQHWTIAARVPGVARLLGACHACGAEVKPEEVICARCGASLEAIRDRQHLGLAPARPLPGRGDPGAIVNDLLRGQTPTAGSAVATRVQDPPRPSSQAPPGKSGADPSRRVSMLERRLRRARRGLLLATSLAIAFALLFASALLVDRFAGEGGDASPVPAVRGGPQTGPVPPGERAGDSEGAALDRSSEPLAAGPETEPDGSPPSRAESLGRRLEGLLATGEPADIDEAERILEASLEQGVESSVIETWRARIERVRRAGELSRTP